MDRAIVSRTRILPALLAVLAGLLALSAAGVHLIVAPAHFEEWWGYGVFFLVLASVQVLYGLGLLAREVRLASSPWYLVAGILGSLLVAVAPWMALAGSADMVTFALPII